MKEDVDMIAFLGGVVTAMVLCAALLQFVAKPNISKKANQMQVLTQKGVYVTMDSGSQVWVWDEKNKVSYVADSEMLDRMCK